MEVSETARKLERVRHLLDNWDFIFSGATTSEPFGFVSGTPSSRPPGKLSDAARHPSVKEMERCLRLLASASPGDYRHLKAYRCGAEWRCVDTWRRVKLPSGKYDWVQHRVSERIVPRWLKPERVAAGEAFIVRVFRGEVFIPDELWPTFAPAA